MNSLLLTLSNLYLNNVYVLWVFIVLTNCSIFFIKMEQPVSKIGFFKM